MYISEEGITKKQGAEFYRNLEYDYIKDNVSEDYLIIGDDGIAEYKD